MNVKAFIEIPKGSSKKYEFNPETGKFKIDRVLPKGIKYPLAYGFIPQTLDADGDPLDIMILTNMKLKQGETIDVKPIAMLRVIDNKQQDDKILAVPVSDPKEKLDKADLMKYGYFFKAYKRGTVIKGLLGKQAAEKEIKSCAEAYRRQNVLP